MRKEKESSNFINQLILLFYLF